MRRRTEIRELLTIIGALTLAGAWFSLHERNFNRRSDGRLWQSAHCFAFLAFAPFLDVNS